MSTTEGFPLPERLFPSITKGASSPALTKQLKKLQLNEMRLRVVKLENNQWLQRRGKKQVGFSTEHKREAMRLFSALDTDACGAISLDELYQPLLASGIVENRAQMLHLFPKSQATDVLEFKEFLAILETGKNELSPIGQLVREYIYMKQEADRKHLPHQVLISMSRRKLMLQAYCGETQASKDKGLKVLKAFSQELSEEKKPLPKIDLLAEKKKQDARRTFWKGSQSARTMLMPYN